MFYSKSFIPIKKNVKTHYDSVSQEFIGRAGIAYQSSAGHYTILPLGKRVLNKIESIVRQELTAIGATELTMPIMQPSSLWQESGRWDVYGNEMYTLKNRTGRDFCLGPTHEELIVDVVRNNLQSYKELPLTLFQIGTKFRDELRPRNGLVRSKEFLMKDAYSFDVDMNSLNDTYDLVKGSYIKIFNRLNLKVESIVADSGEIGGSFSEEFIAYADSGDDKFKVSSSDSLQVEKEYRGIEVGHIFKLGTRYSEVMGLKINTSHGLNVPLMMGCYGIGISRILPVLVEQHHDSKGIVWPRSVAPFDVEIVPVRYDISNIRESSLNVYTTLKNMNIDVLLDDRDTKSKFNDADLLGIPYKLIISSKTLSRNCVELEDRKSGLKTDVDISNINVISNLFTK